MKRGQFTTALQFGTQIYSYVSGDEDTRSKSRNTFNVFSPIHVCNFADS